MLTWALSDCRDDVRVLHFFRGGCSSSESDVDMALPPASISAKSIKRHNLQCNYMVDLMKGGITISSNRTL